MKHLIRSLFLMLLCFLVTDLVAQPAHVKEMKRRKEAMKKEREYDREMRKAEDEYYRELMKAEDEYYRELMKADAEAYREYMKDRKEAMKEGRRLPPPPGYGPPFDREKYDEGYEYDDYEYDEEYEDDRYERRRRRPTRGRDGGEVIIQGEVKVKGRKRIPIPIRRKGGRY